MGPTPTLQVRKRAPFIRIDEAGTNRLPSQSRGLGNACAQLNRHENIYLFIFISVVCASTPFAFYAALFVQASHLGDKMKILTFGPRAENKGLPSNAFMCKSQRQLLSSRVYKYFPNPAIIKKGRVQAAGRELISFSNDRDGTACRWRERGTMTRTHSTHTDDCLSETPPRRLHGTLQGREQQTRMGAQGDGGRPGDGKAAETEQGRQEHWWARRSTFTGGTVFFKTNSFTFEVVTHRIKRNAVPFDITL